MLISNLDLLVLADALRLESLTSPIPRPSACPINGRRSGTVAVGPAPEVRHSRFRKVPRRDQPDRSAAAPIAPRPDARSFCGRGAAPEGRTPGAAKCFFAAGQRPARAGRDFRFATRGSDSSWLNHYPRRCLKCGAACAVFHDVALRLSWSRSQGKLYSRCFFNESERCSKKRRMDMPHSANLSRVTIGS